MELDIEMLIWLTTMGAVMTAGALAWTKARPSLRRRRRVITLVESDPNDAYTC